MNERRFYCVFRIITVINCIYNVNTFSMTEKYLNLTNYAMKLIHQ
ncbi:CLUMA_CG011074, isoform A [Clunio marinus]|uniref:CLUMA_CG011074, isoform A n=1 Tax=Clunio marinus TaxID=568069 RepID=A0A1J1IFB8_9DIPT|nr:CLUMA_CG011074, isoform A [Clunio marinus]